SSPSFSDNRVFWYCSEMTLEGSRTDSKISRAASRLETAANSGPTDPPLFPKRWHWMHCPWMYAFLPASKERPDLSLSRFPCKSCIVQFLTNLREGSTEYSGVVSLGR